MTFEIILKADYYLVCTSNNSVETSERCVHIEQNKGFLIAQPNTVIHPGAMVVHSHHTPATDGAVVRMWWFFAVAF